jgi:hypothetical protein
MQPVISDLVQRYENGRLSRRELIQGLGAGRRWLRDSAARAGRANCERH